MDVDNVDTARALIRVAMEDYGLTEAEAEAVLERMQEAQRLRTAEGDVVWELTEAEAADRDRRVARAEEVLRTLEAR